MCYYIYRSILMPSPPSSSHGHGDLEEVRCLDLPNMVVINAMLNINFEDQGKDID